jgi:heterotetrameric sarcosine oxidase delta subunit
MLLIPCPYCGERPETEFHYGGEAHIARPEDPSTLSDDQWAEFLFIRQNRKGAYRERWVHSAGCRRWFNMLRNTHTHEIVQSYKIGESVPDPKPSSKETA